jgi:hypothetical protein
MCWQKEFYYAVKNGQLVSYDTPFCHFINYRDEDDSEDEEDSEDVDDEEDENDSEDDAVVNDEDYFYCLIYEGPPIYAANVKTIDFTQIGYELGSSKYIIWGEGIPRCANIAEKLYNNIELTKVWRKNDKSWHMYHIEYGLQNDTTYFVRYVSWVRDYDRHVEMGFETRTEMRCSAGGPGID